MRNTLSILAYFLLCLVALPKNRRGFVLVSASSEDEFEKASVRGHNQQTAVDQRRIKKNKDAKDKTAQQTQFPVEPAPSTPATPAQQAQFPAEPLYVVSKVLKVPNPAPAPAPQDQSTGGLDHVPAQVLNRADASNDLLLLAQSGGAGVGSMSSPLRRRRLVRPRRRDIDAR